MPRQKRPSPPRIDLWQEAAAFAARAHRDHIRLDGKTPYVSHPARVALTLVSVFGCVEPVAIAAALLHDTIEDTRTDYDDIEERFGPKVADAVAALTQNAALPQARRDEEYYGRLAQAPWYVKAIKLADLYDNISDVPTLTKEARDRKRPRFIKHARRMIALAAADARTHSSVARGVAALRELL